MPWSCLAGTKVPSPRRYPRDVADPVYRPIIWTAKGLFRALALEIDVVGAEHIPLEGGAILAANHTSYLDYVFVGLPADMRGHRLVRFMAKDGIWKPPVAGALMRGMRHIPVDRESGSQAFKDAVRMLRDGELIGIFPEATMSRSFEIKEMKSGAVRMAAMAGVPIIPVIVFGGQRILSYDRRDLSRHQPIAVTVGEPMTVGKRDDMEARHEELAARMRALLDETIARYPAPSAGEDAWWLPKRLGGTAPSMEEAQEIERRVRADKAAKRRAKQEKRGR